jgi:glucan biosynthesis protein
LLVSRGFELNGSLQVVEVGVEIDRVAVAPSGAAVWFEYKGSVQGSRPGLMRTDTLKKAVANGALLQRLVEKPAYVVLTSHLPSSGAGLAMLQTAIELQYFDDVICVYDPTQTGRLAAL